MVDPSDKASLIKCFDGHAAVAMTNLRQWPVAAVFALWVGLLAPAAAAEPPTCVTPQTLYIPIETVAGPLGFRGETRAQYLDRVYGKGVWREGSAGLAAIARVDNSVNVTLREQEGVMLERVDVVAEARLEFLAKPGALGVVTGHREIGRYALAAGAHGDLSVPLSVLRESGALLVIVSARRPSPPAAVVLVEAWAYVSPGCERRVLVADRLSAIRLNRQAGAK